MTGERGNAPWKPRAWRAIRMLLRVAPLVALAAWVWATQPLSEVSARVADADWPLLVAAVLVNLLMFMPIRAVRWRIAMRSPPPFPTIVAAMLEGSAVAAVFGTAMGDVTRSSRLRGAESFAQDMGAVLAERACEFLSLSVLFGAVAAAGVVPRAWLAVPAAVLAALLVVVRWRAVIVARAGNWPRVQAGLESLTSALTARRVAAMPGLAFAGWASEVVMLHLVLEALGLPSGAGVAALIVIAINVAITLPGVPANLGTFEAGVVVALGQAGVAQATALSFALLYHALHLVPTVLIGGSMWAIRGPRAGRG